MNGKGWDGDPPLANAILGEHSEIVILLLDNGADICNNFVRDAIYGSNKEIYYILCQYGYEYACKLMVWCQRFTFKSLRESKLVMLIALLS